MGRVPSKAFNNIYCRARLKAAEINPVFQSRESTAYELNIPMDSLISYELDLCKSVPPDRVALMAKAYNASYLLENYCCSCPIGKMFTEQGLLEKISDNQLDYEIELLKRLEAAARFYRKKIERVRSNKEDK
ncbi:MAG: transcriptional regulator [Clostridium celatum]|nr:transcriptional regulator [Clostridium celatum]